jgi:hypothetical protein
VTADPHRVTDSAALASIAETLRSQIVPALEDQWTRTAAIQLAALADLLHTRPADPAEARRRQLLDLLAELGEPVGATGSYQEVLTTCAAAMGTWGDDDPRRTRLRSVLMTHLDEDLAINMALMPAFRGLLPDA